MKLTFKSIILILGLIGALSFKVSADNNKSSLKHGYEVTIQNLTAYSLIGPLVVSTHQADYHTFTIGEPASEGLAAISILGSNFQQLIDELAASDKVLATELTPGTAPGKITTITIPFNKENRYLSLAGMIAPSNDGFLGADAIKGPRKLGEIVTVDLVVYDSGALANTEIAPPGFIEFIGTESGQPTIEQTSEVMQPEGFVYVHRGIKGIGDWHPALYNWNNPFARLTIKRVLLEN